MITEWGYEDVVLFARLNDQQQWSHAFGPGPVQVLPLPLLPGVHGRQLRGLLAQLNVLLRGEHVPSGLELRALRCGVRQE